MRVAQSIPSIPSLPFKDWCEEHDAVENFWDYDKNPPCPNCGKETEIRKTIPGLQYLCPDYAYCGSRIKNKHPPTSEVSK